MSGRTLPSNPFRVTVKTISKRAGVAASTVSRALNGDPRISEPTRKRIEEIARSEGYTPNAMAVGLVTRHSGVIGLAVGRLDNPFYAILIERLHSALARRGRRVMILNVGGDSLDKETMQAVVRYQMEGCIIAAATLDSTAADICYRARLPMVMINRVARVHSCAVSCDNRAGARQLGELLIKAGHRRIAYIAGRADTSTSEDRRIGLRHALAEAGLAAPAYAGGEYSYRNGFDAALELIRAPSPPDAIFAVNDIVACGAIDALRGEGIAVPDDISVVGFDDVPLASWSSYRLTTVAQPIDTMIDRALDLLDERIENRERAGVDVQVRGPLRLRHSCRLPAGLRPEPELAEDVPDDIAARLG